MNQEHQHNEKQRDDSDSDLIVQLLVRLLDDPREVVLYDSADSIPRDHSVYPIEAHRVSRREEAPPEWIP